ncbi:DUF3369 domain-containing protein [Thiospirochaeta perfilievii]|uniref:DUF3369 domain-containing protein n=1 Tax=Thiospirochaeta perfilievii TaxID=252967 RepID=A0A5C1QIG9_9SPIO|nr:response regulator [Thiospirochaeta perfilievii]QEN06042.1 DUF3369 domain-containing protein [Thiospirochaeta perfilievii]
MDDFIFAEEITETQKISLKPWKILISDDEKEIHTITKIVLSNFIYENRKVEIYDAYSRSETIEILKEHDDIAVLLLDVVMETDDAGLLVARDIRETLKNNLIRIILRTGQPGSAPEKDVISKYDINDYKEKTELTTTKLFTTVMTALRSYRDLHLIEKNKKGLEQILESTRRIMQFKSSALFADSVLNELIVLLNLSKEVELKDNKVNAMIVDTSNNQFNKIASKGSFENLEGEYLFTKSITDKLNKAISLGQSYFDHFDYVGYFKNENDMVNLILISSESEINQYDKSLLDIFSNNVAVAFNNVHLTHEILDTQKEIIETLSEVVEKRSKETSNHVLRVAQVSRFLALKYGLPEDEATKITMASPLHDIGKTGIPDSILLKPDKLTEEEYEIMKQHTQIGRDILGRSTRPLLKAASIISYEHHEKWNGKGYPNQKKGDDIHIYGRITALADVFDALYHKRCYKEAWPLEKIIDLIKGERGEHFDPKLVDIFLENIDDILGIVKRLS